MRVRIGLWVCLFAATQVACAGNGDVTSSKLFAEAAPAAKPTTPSNYFDRFDKPDTEKSGASTRSAGAQQRHHKTSPLDFSSQGTPVSVSSSSKDQSHASQGKLVFSPKDKLILSSAEQACNTAYSSISSSLEVDVWMQEAVSASVRQNWNATVLDVCEKPAASGNAKAQALLGLFYASLGGIPKGGGQAAYDKALYWLHRAATQRSASAENRLGEMYRIGEGVRKDTKTTVEWFRKAAFGNNEFAMGSLANAYYYGQGTDQNYVLARRWYLAAARNGLTYPTAQRLAEIYYNGLGTKKDYKAALKWYQKYYDHFLVGTTAFSIAMIYANGGYGVEKDWTAAVQWWRKAAAKKSPAAMFNIGVAYATGQGVDLSGAAAADWCYKAGIAYLADNDRDGALSALGRIKLLQQHFGATLPNGFLADKLLAKIYGGSQSQSAESKAPAKQRQEIVEGSGWPTVGGFVVTNHHVIAGAHTLWVITPGGARMTARVAVDDTHNDLALLSVDKPAALPPAFPLATRVASTGKHVFTIGYPHPDLLGTSAKLTDGIVSSVTGLGNDPRLYQISVPLQAGNSGGPLLDMNGAVVGIVVAKLDAAKVFQWTGDLPENVNYAIKASYLKALLQSATPPRKTAVLPTRRSSLQALDKRVAPSVVMIIAKH